MAERVQIRQIGDDEGRTLLRIILREMITGGRTCPHTAPDL
ncbi:hypothetical protein ABZ379_41570 [Streptomyces canus]